VTLVGSGVPRLFTPPAGELTPETSRGYECIQFAEQVLGLDLMPWQRWALVHGLELADGGAYRFRTVLVCCARQQGKSTLMQVLSLWRLYVDGAGLVIGSAQNLSMAEEAWDGALSMAEGVPDLAAEVAHVSRVNGDKWFRLTAGQRYRVTAASRRGARGLSSDLVLLDELREHTSWDAWSAATKTTMARPAPQVWGFSNAGDARSVVLAELRGKALAGAADRTSTLGIFEWSAPDGCALDDRAGWVAANPALGHRMPEQAIASALETDPEPVFRTEVLCQAVETLDGAIPLDLWSALADPLAERGASPTFAVATAPDRSASAIAVAWRRPDHAVHVMLADYRPTAAWVPARVAELRARWGRRVLVDTASRGLVTDADEPSPAEQAKAHNALSDTVTAGTVRHSDETALNVAVRAARWRPLGDTRVLDRQGSTDISPLIAAALAVSATTARQKSPQIHAWPSDDEIAEWERAGLRDE